MKMRAMFIFLLLALPLEWPGVEEQRQWQALCLRRPKISAK